MRKGFWKIWNNRRYLGGILGVASAIFGLSVVIFKLDANKSWWLAILIVLSSLLIFLFRVIRLPDIDPIMRDLLSQKSAKRLQAKSDLGKLNNSNKAKILIRTIIRSGEVNWQNEILEEIVPASSLSNADNLKFFLNEIAKNKQDIKIDDETLNIIFEMLNAQQKKKIREELHKILQSSRNETIKLGAIIVAPFWSNNVFPTIIQILENEKLRSDIRETAAISLGKMKCVSAIPIFLKIYDTSKDEMRKRLLKAAEEIGQGEQSFFQYAALCKKSGDAIRGEAMRLLVANPEDRIKARKCLCSILLNLQGNERPIVRSQAAQYLAELNDNAELALLDFCEDEDIQISLRKTGLEALQRDGLAKIGVIIERLTVLKQSIKRKIENIEKDRRKAYYEFDKEIQETFKYLIK